MTNKFSKDPKDIRPSSIGFISAEKLPSIVKEFNQELNSTIQRPSILKKINFLGISLFTHRILAMDELRLVQRNGIPELAAHSGNYQRRKKFGRFGNHGHGLDHFEIILSRLGSINSQTLMKQDILATVIDTSSASIKAAMQK